MAGNKGFGDALADSFVARAPARPSLPTDGVLASRSNAFAEIASGKAVNDRTLWVDPARCRPWQHHNRDAARLNEDSCRDLIDSIKAEGRQRLPAIVRRLKDDPSHDYEIIAGARRHWTIGWLRTNNYPDFEFLVTVQPLTDEEAFRLADVENRARQDLTDLERGRDYLKALDLFYGGKQSAMAARLNVERAWLSRLLDLARLPSVVIDCFADPGELRVEHAKQLAPLLKAGPAARRLLAAAEELGASQRTAIQQGRVPARPSEAVRFLAGAAAEQPVRRKLPAATRAEASSAQSPMLRAKPRRGGGVRIEILPNSGATREQWRQAFAELLDQHPGDLPFG